jgi:putative transposase
MARALRIEYPNACYHVVNRGNKRGVVFHDDWHYKTFIDKLGYFAAEFRVTVFAYCCMPNHFHLYLKTPGANLSRFMQSFQTSFCVSSNKKRRTSGHIFQGRFKAHLVEDECYRSRLS